MTPRGRRHRIRTTGQARRLRSGILAARDRDYLFDPADRLQMRAFLASTNSSLLWLEQGAQVEAWG